MQSYNGNRQQRRKTNSKKNAVLYKPKIEYTDDGFAVTTLYLRSLRKEITREQLFNYFSTFGKLQNVRIYPKPTFSFGFVTFARAESAAKALEKRVHKINGRNISVAIADSWHQEKPLEMCNNHESESPQSIKDVKLPIELTNATGTYLLNLNDDCLYEIFSLNYVSIVDLCSVAESSTRLKQIANRIFAGAHKSCDLNKMSLKTIHEMRRFLINFGPSITELSIGPSYDFESMSDGMSTRVLDLVIKYCTKTLESLAIKDYEIKEYLAARLRPMFHNLQKLHIEDVDIDGDGKPLFSNCAALVELKVINLVNYVNEVEMIFENRFPKLERFKYKRNDEEYDDINLENFVSRHKRLKTFSIKGFNDDCTSLLPVIADNCKELEKLQIKGYSEAIQSDYEKALKSLLALNNLKKLKINGAEVTVTKFIQELPQLSSLELLELWNAKCDAGFTPALAQMKNLNVLRLNYCGELKNLNPLADLESLSELSILLRSQTDKVELDLVQMIKRLSNLKKLVLRIATFKLEKRMYLRIVDVVRARTGIYPSALEIKSNTIDEDVVDFQFDGKNNEIVKLVKIMFHGSEDGSYDDSWSDDYSDSDYDPYFDDDDDDDDGFDVGDFIHPAYMLHFLHGLPSSDDESRDENLEDEVW